jgi:hypothetical protein
MDVGGNVGNITSLSDGVHIEYTLIGGNVGNVTGTAEGVYTDGVYISETLIGGNIGNITGISQSGNGVAMNSVHIRGNVGNLIGDVGGYGGEGISLHGVLVDGSVGNITGTSQDDSGVYLEGVSVVGDVGNIEAPIGWLEVYGTAIGGSVGDITAFLGVFLGDDEGGDHVRIGGDVGNITSETTHVDIVNVIVGGDVGLIKGFGTPWGGPSVYIEGFNVGGDITGIVGVAGDVTLNYMTVGGNIGDITSEAGNVNFDPYNYNEGPSGGGDWEWGNIQVVGNIGNITAFLDVNIHGAYDYDYYYYDGYYGAGINVGGSVGNITAITGDIDVYNFSVAGSIGNITALDSVRMGDDYYDYYYEGGLIRVGGSVGNITSLTSFISLGGGSGVFHVAGSVGNITGEYYVEMSYVGVGGNVGNITSKFEYIDIGEKVEVVGNVGNISAFLDLTLGYGGEGGTQYGFAIGGTLGTAVSLKGDITADLVVDGNIADIYAAEGDIYSATIVSGGNIGSFALGTGVRAGNFIWDDVTIVAKGTIGVVEARVLGYSTQYIDTLPGTITIGTTVLVPDNDLSMDFQNDYLVIADSNDDNIIELSPVIQAYMASNGYLPDEVTPRSELLVDGKIDSQEALDIIAFGGEKLPDIWDPLNTDTVDIIFQNIFKEVEIIDVDDVVSTELNIDVYNLEPNFSYLTIIAEGTDPSSTVRAIGRISSTVMTTTDLYVDAVRGGIGELSSYGILALSDERIVDIAESRGLLPSSISIEELRAILAGGTITPPQTVDDNGEEINIPGDDRGEDELDFAALLAGGDDLAKGIIRAKTSIDTLRGDDGLLDLDIQVTGGITINPSLPLDQMITTTGGVGLVGGIVSAGEMEINIVTGGSIGTTVTTGGSINNNYDAFGNIGSIIAKDNITGTYTAAMGYIGNAISGTGQARFVSGGVLAASGDISADFKTGLGMGNLAAPLGNVSGSLTTGGVVKGENPDYVIESSGADDDDFEVNLSTAAIKLYSVFTTLDTDSATPAPASMTVGSQTIDVTGSSSGLRVNVGVAFGFATDMTVTGSGSLDFDSTGDVGVMTVEPGANVSVSSINVDGDFGGFININKNAKVANITATEDIGQVIGYGSVQNITAGEDIGEVKSLFKDVKNVFAGDDIDKIFAKTNVQNIGAQDRIGEIIAGKNVKIVRAYEIGTISAANVSQVFALGDIDLISASGNVTDVSSGGDITVEAGKNATRIAGASGKVAAGGKLSKVSCSLEKCSPPPPVPVYVDC